MEIEDSESQHLRKLSYQCLAAGSLGAVLMAISMLGIAPTIQTDSINWFWLFTSLITFFVMRYSGGHFYSGAWQAFKAHLATMDTLVAMGTGAAWLYSTTVAALPHLLPENSHHVYFESALIIIAFINLGAALETRARGKTGAAIRQLMGLQPKTARKIQGDQEFDIPIAEIQIDDLLKVRPGEKIAVDGVVAEGESEIDEAMLTGESALVLKKSLDLVSAGTINKDGSLIIKALAIGQDTVLAQIVALVKQAQYSKPPIGKLTDKIASFFVPFVLIVATITALVWFNYGLPPVLPKLLMTSTAVLLIACPCALGLATPISIMVAIGKGAQYGILIRNGEALQRAYEIDTIILDKTGTLTEGVPSLENVYPIEGRSIDEVLSFAASIEKYSEHPWAQAIVNEAQARKLKLKKIEHFTNNPGKGVHGYFKSEALLVGSVHYVTNNEIDLNLLYNDIEKITNRMQTPIVVAYRKEAIGVIAVADSIKAGAADIVNKLQKRSLDVVLLTGDNNKTARFVADKLGITNVIAEVTPDYKSQKVAHFQQRGHVVAMVGDGINDAPALAQADVGFAIGTGTDIAMSSSDITLMSGQLIGIDNAIELSKKTMRNIKQNLFGAFFYNVISIPVAAGVLYPMYGILLSPMIAGAAMAASSLTVVLNANRLRRLQLKRVLHG